MRLPILALLLLLCTCALAQNTDRKIVLHNPNSVSPLFVVDGIVYEEGSLNEIDPNNIEAISVLKDAAATVAYGPAGDNGVVVIVTKNGNYTRPDYTLTPDEIPADIFNRYAELNFGDGKEVVYLLNGKPQHLKKLSKLDASAIASIRVYEGADKALRLRQKGKDVVVVVTLK